MVLTTCTLVSACSGDSPSPTHVDRYPSREFAATSWDTVSAFGPETPDDTSLVAPATVTTWDQKLVVLDWVRATVSVMSDRGRPLWQFGHRGRGPGELEQVAYVRPTPWGTLWVIDGKNLKVVELDSAGQLLKEIPTRHLPAVPGSVMFPSHRRVVLGTQSPKAGRITADPDSLSVIQVRPFLWADSVNHRYDIRVRSASDSATGQWVEALYFGPGFVVGQADSVFGRYRYVDDIPWARKGNPRLTRLKADSARYGAVKAEVFEGEIYLLFGGRPLRMAHESEPTELVDVYGFDGGYRRSYLLPMSADDFALFPDGRFVVLSSYAELYPRIYVLRPNGFVK